ncbi:MAG: phage tail protein [Deltaproteobacteria bacterium]|jgi:phage tail-like protein
MSTDQRRDPFRTYNFEVEIDGTTVGSFSEVSGLTAEGDPVEYREGTDRPNTVRKLVGLRKYSNITLKRGYISDTTMWDWYGNVANGLDDRRNGTITLKNEAHVPVMRWNFENAWLNKIEGPSLNATGNDVAVETIELCHEGLTMELATSE